MTQQFTFIRARQRIRRLSRQGQTASKLVIPRPAGRRNRFFLRTLSATAALFLFLANCAPTQARVVKPTPAGKVHSLSLLVRYIVGSKVISPMFAMQANDSPRDPPPPAPAPHPTPPPPPSPAPAPHPTPPPPPSPAPASHPPPPPPPTPPPAPPRDKPPTPSPDRATVVSTGFRSSSQHRRDNS